jgi:hypothetical protein
LPSPLRVLPVPDGVPGIPSSHASNPSAFPARILPHGSLLSGALSGSLRIIPRQSRRRLGPVVSRFRRSMGTVPMTVCGSTFAFGFFDQPPNGYHNTSGLVLADLSRRPISIRSSQIV